MSWNKKRFWPSPSPPQATISPATKAKSRRSGLPRRSHSIHIHVNAALSPFGGHLRQSSVLPQIPNDLKQPNAYRKPPTYGTLSPSRRAMRSTGMKRVLIIEDDRDNVELVRYNLANEGFRSVLRKTAAPA